MRVRLEKALFSHPEWREEVAELERIVRKLQRSRQWRSATPSQKAKMVARLRFDVESALLWAASPRAASGAAASRWSGWRLVALACAAVIFASISVILAVVFKERGGGAEADERLERPQ